MTVGELRRQLLRYDDDCVVILGDSVDGWQNIEEVNGDVIGVSIIGEKHTVFSED